MPSPALSPKRDGRTEQPRKVTTTKDEAERKIGRRERGKKKIKVQTRNLTARFISRRTASVPLTIVSFSS